MIWNAEFHRNVWLEINFTRLITFPLLLALIFWAFFISKDTPNVDINKMGSHLSGVALSLFALITVLWGAQLASNSITEEAQAQTWDWQRLSAQSPVELVIGKLFGSTILAWYGGLCCLVAYVIFSRSTLEGFRMSWVVLAIASAIFAQAAAMMLTLATPPEQRLVYQQKRSFGVARLIVLLATLYAIGLSTIIWTNDHIPTLHWYQWQPDLLPFCTWSAVIWASWAVFGCIQRTATLLHAPTTPLPWITFTLFCMMYFTGFTPESINHDQTTTHYYMQFAFGVIFSLMVGVTMLETKAPLEWRLWFDALRTRNHARAWQRTPRWVATFVLAFVTLLFALTNSADEFHIFLSVALLLFVRDITVLYWLHWTPQPRRPHLAFAIYLMLVYLLLPFLLKRINWLFYPNVEKPVTTIGIFLIETFVATAFLLQRWEQYYSAEFTRNEEEENLQKSLIENEKVIYTARVSIGIQAPLFLLGLLIIAVGFGLHFYSPLASVNIFNFNLDNVVLWLFVLAAAFCWAKALVRHIIARRNTQLTFTNKRVIVKIGYPEQQNIELPLAKIGSIQVNQTLRGRIFNYGKLIISSIGNPQITLPDIANPSEFRRTLMEAQEHK